MKAFETWTHAGTRYLAVPTGNGNVGICSEKGENFGSWFTAAAFRKRQREGHTESLRLGIAQVRIIYLGEFRVVETT